MPTVDEYARHARKFGDPQTVYETAYGDGLTLDKLLVLGHILVKLDPERGYRHKGKWEAFTWRWAQGFHARRDRYQLDANGDDDVLRMTEWEEALLFGGGGTFNTASPNSPNAALAPPQSGPLGASPYALVVEDRFANVPRWGSDTGPVDAETVYPTRLPKLALHG